ncbi:MAG TPA: helix-turn-helix domain-containing protein [Methanoregulaceae archaeon]|nr:helix-turn-helix domain-containing protein [Methanoregulaceae archaeon]
MSESPCNIMKCDSVARDYLPGIRAEMVARLVNGRGMSQSDAARHLGVTRAAISQYMSRKRGADITLCSELDLLIDRWALAVTTGDEPITICDVCKCAMKKS